eukprot:5246772-Alexandrium_andersonii.AAC.1
MVRAGMRRKPVKRPRKQRPARPEGDAPLWEQLLRQVDGLRSVEVKPTDEQVINAFKDAIGKQRQWNPRTQAE